MAKAHPKLKSSHQIAYIFRPLSSSKSLCISTEQNRLQEGPKEKLREFLSMRSNTIFIVMPKHMKQGQLIAQETS